MLGDVFICFYSCWQFLRAWRKGRVVESLYLDAIIATAPVLCPEKCPFQLKALLDRREIGFVFAASVLWDFFFPPHKTRNNGRKSVWGIFIPEKPWCAFLVCFFFCIVSLMVSRDQNKSFLWVFSYHFLMNTWEKCYKPRRGLYICLELEILKRLSS